MYVRAHSSNRFLEFEEIVCINRKHARIHLENLENSDDARDSSTNAETHHGLNGLKSRQRLHLFSVAIESVANVG